MALPSEDGVGAARSLRGPRGSATPRFAGSSLRTLALRFRSDRQAAPPGQALAPTHVGAPDRPIGLSVQELEGAGSGTLLLSGELDAGSVPTLEAALVRCTAMGVTTITLDLGGLGFIDSAGLWTITSAKTWCDRRGYGFSLLPGPTNVHHVFEVTGLSDVLPFQARGPLVETPSNF
jgi:anti-anti-sigma factor